MRFTHSTIIIVLLLFLAATAAAQTGAEDYLTWTLAQAESIGKSTRERGSAGGGFDLRVTTTDRAINYKMRATLMTPEVIRASARFAQLRDRLTDDQTRALVDEAEKAGDVVAMIEIDPNEGSGVIPLDWRVFLQPRGLRPGSDGAVPGVKAPGLRNVRALTGVVRRDYDYDIFWVTFPLVGPDKTPLISPETTDIQLIVGIYGKEGRISWKMPASIREKIASLSRK